MLCRIYVFHLCCSEDGISIVSLKNDSTVVAIVVILVSTLTVDDAVVPGRKDPMELYSSLILGFGTACTG